MKPLAELLAAPEPAWPLVQGWIASAKNAVEVLPCARPDGERALYGLQLPASAALGAIALHTGGLRIDGGWVTLLGADGPRMKASLGAWNSTGVLLGGDGSCVVGFDALGGLFALDGGALEVEFGAACYFAPDSLAWERIGRGYSDLLQLALSGDLAQFYGHSRWQGWESAAAQLEADQAISLYPPLWTKEGQDPANASQRRVPALELIGLNLRTGARLGPA